MARKKKEEKKVEVIENNQIISGQVIEEVVKPNETLEKEDEAYLVLNVNGKDIPFTKEDVEAYEKMCKETEYWAVTGGDKKDKCTSGEKSDIVAESKEKKENKKIAIKPQRNNKVLETKIKPKPIYGDFTYYWNGQNIDY